MRGGYVRQYMKMGIVGFALVGVMLFSSGSWGDRQTSLVCAARMIIKARSQGYTLRNATFRFLKQGQWIRYNLPMYRGNKYLILACGDTGVRDFNLALYSYPQGELATEDETQSRVATASFEPARSDVYLLYASMIEGSGYYTVAVLYK